MKWWWLSAGISALLIAVLISLWWQMNKYEIKGQQVEIEHEITQRDESPQLTNMKRVTEYLDAKWDNSNTTDPAIQIKTGIFIQSLKFFNSSEVNLSGYIWQHYEDGKHDAIKPCHASNQTSPEKECNEVGFILPEQVDSGSDIDPREVYRFRDEANKSEVIGWYFEATLRQPFDYKKYPFDHKQVWVRLWAKDFSKNIVLVPDFEAYNDHNPDNGNDTDEEDIFGIEQNIVLGTWERQNTYFDYKLSAYDTNFGINNYIGQNGFPELHYNFIVKRKFANAFIVYLLPLFLVATLLFAAMLTVSERDDLSNRLGFSTSGFIGTSSALFFVVMLAHIQLREQFAGTSIVYIEYFYILMYAMLVVVTANTFLFSIRSAKGSKYILYKDNLIPKVAYWPAVLGCLIVITLLVN